MSLTTRILLIMLGVLSVGLIVAGALLYATVRDAQTKTIDGQLNARLAWLESALDVEYEENKVELEARGTPSGMATYWTVATGDGRILWSSAASPEHGPVISRNREITFGEDAWPIIAGKSLVPGHDEEEPDEAWRMEKSHERIPTVYRFPESVSRIVLRLSSYVPTREMHEELERLRDHLVIGIPLAILLLGTVLVFLVRWQLGPLTHMAEESEQITPDDLSRRIGEAGSSLECRRLRSSVNAMIDRLAEGIARERRFSQAAAHDLRTPLAQLRTQVDIILRHPRTPAEYQSALQDMTGDIERLQNMISGLLLLARAEACPVDDTHAVVFADVLRELHVAEALPQDSGPISVLGEESLIIAAIRNVLDNAAQYAPQQPAEVTFTLEDEVLHMIVSDRGEGIPADARERIFEPLVRLDQARTCHNQSGFGLGLAIARRTLRAFGGNLFCRDRSDGHPGAEFVLVFRRASLFPGGETAVHLK